MFGTGGLQYVGGDRSIQRGSNMHDLYFGLYSRGGTLVYYKYIQIFQQKGENISIDCNANQIGHHPDHKYQGLQNTSTSTSTNTNTK